MRVYLGATLPGLAAIRAAGAVPAGSTGWTAAPPSAEDDVEELEYAATLAAAQDSLDLLGTDPAAHRRRVVLAVDVPTTAAEVDQDGAVRLTAPVGRDRLAAVLVDDPAVVLAEAEDEPLMWYAAQELDDLLD